MIEVEGRVFGDDDADVVESVPLHGALEDEARLARTVPLARALVDELLAGRDEVVHRVGRLRRRQVQEPRQDPHVVGRRRQLLPGDEEQCV